MSRAAEEAPLIATARDPGGRLIVDDGQVLRAVEPGALEDFLALVDAQWTRDAVAAGRLVGCDRLPPDAPLPPAVANDPHWTAARAEGRVFTHPRVRWITVAEEWTAPALVAAATLTLDLLSTALRYGWRLKDAHADNVLFEGARPVFVDWLSFERRPDGDPAWRPYAQFVEQFLLPLLLRRALGWPTAAFAGGRARRAEEAWRALPMRARATRDGLLLAGLPAMLSARARGRSNGVVRMPTVQPPVAEQRLNATVQHLRRALRRLAGGAAVATTWTDYAPDRVHSEAYAEARLDVVARWVARRAPQTLLDVGGNDGRIAEALARRLGVSVLLAESDAGALEQAAQRLADTSLTVQPAYVDLLDPTPASGWGARRRPGFVERVRGTVDGVLFLSVMHHLCIGTGHTAPDLVSLAAAVGARWTIIEWVPSSDALAAPMLAARGLAPYGDAPETLIDRLPPGASLAGRELLPNGRTLLLVDLA